MEFFHNPQIDWMGKKKYFITVSIILLAVGIGSIIWQRGLKYGVDFRGGTMVYVKFAHPPDLNSLRHQLDKENLHGATLERYGPSSEHEIIVSLDLRTTSRLNALDTGKDDIVKALTKLYGEGPAGKIEFNNSSPGTIAERLLVDDPLHLAPKGPDVARNAYEQLAAAMTHYRQVPPQSGVIEDFNQLKAVPGVNAQVVSDLQKDFYLSQFSVFNTEIVGPKVGAHLRRQAVYVVLAALAAMLIYVWIRYELIFGVAAIIATFHDVIITLGIFSLLSRFGFSVSLTVIAAFLTLIGYSMNDTVVTFDRIRENMRMNKRENFRDLINRSINQVLSRTILTSGLTFIAVLALFIFGGEVIHGFSLVLVIGVIIGTYSSFAIASPLVLRWEHKARATIVGKPGGTPGKPGGRPGPVPVGPKSKTKGYREPAGARH